MSSPVDTTFVSGTTITSAWLNGVNDSVIDYTNGKIVSITDAAFGAVGDGVTDNTAAIQAALNYVHSMGGGTVLIPVGRFRKADTAGSSLIMYSNTTLRGYGDSSIIFFDDKDTVPRSGNDFLIANNTSNISFENFKIESTALTYLNETNQKQLLCGEYINGLRVVNMTIVGARYMATAFSRVKNAVITGNRLENCLRDGLRCVNSWNVIISNNTLKRVSDDAIAVHSLDGDTLVGDGVVISNNTLEECQGIKVLGAKNLLLTNNILRRSIRGPISVRIPGTGSEGNSPQFNINISNNTITDSFGSLGTNYGIQVSGIARVGLGIVPLPGVGTSPYPYNYLNDIDTGSVVNVGISGIRIENNHISRTFPNVASYTSLGYGQLFDRNTVGIWSDPSITDTTFAIHAIDITGPVYGLRVSGNMINGGSSGFQAIRCAISGTANLSDYSATSIVSNTIWDWPATGIGISSTGSSNSLYIVKDNIIDLDPYFRAASHNSDNTWSSSGSVVGIQNSATIANLIASGNIFSHLGTPITQPLIASMLKGLVNYVICQPTGVGDLVTNKGVRNIVRSVGYMFVIYDGDPTSATFRSIITLPQASATSIPTTGFYITGHIVTADSAAVSGSAGSKYNIIGWRRLTDGTSHVLNTDWVELRCLTGT